MVAKATTTTAMVVNRAAQTRTIKTTNTMISRDMMTDGIRGTTVITMNRELDMFACSAVDA